MVEIDSPIFCIYPELLIDIFAFAIHDSPNQSLALLLLTWVCRRWRSTALNSPLLWNHISTTNLGFLQECISRSGGMPLTFVTHVMRHGYAEPIPTVLRSLPQTEKLDLVGDATSVLAEHRLDLWRAHAPLLKTFHVSRFAFPSQMFSGHAPLLQDLQLGQCKFRTEDFPPLPELRTLFIRNPSNRLPISSLLTMIRTSPQLQKLYIESSLTGEGSDQMDRLPLPELQHLFLQLEYTHHVHDFLSRTLIPATARIHLRIDGRDEHVRILDAIKHCRTPSTMTIRSLYIIACALYQECHITEEDDMSQSALTTHRFACVTEVHMIESFCSHLELFDLETIEVSERFPVIDPSTSFWTHFSSLPKLRTVKLATFFATSFFEHLFEAHRPLWEAKPLKEGDELNIIGFEDLALATLSFASLQTLEFEHLYESSTLDQAIMGVIGPVLKVRSLLDRPLRKLVVGGILPQEEQLMIPHLESMVVELRYWQDAS